MEETWDSGCWFHISTSKDTYAHWQRKVSILNNSLSPYSGASAKKITSEQAQFSGMWGQNDSYLLFPTPPHSLPSLESQLSLCCELKGHSLLIITINRLLLTLSKKSITKEMNSAGFQSETFIVLMLYWQCPGTLYVMLIYEQHVMGILKVKIFFEWKRKVNFLKYLCKSLESFSIYEF